MRKTLKKCPFCGKKPRLDWYWEQKAGENEGKINYFVECANYRDCYIRPETRRYDEKWKAIYTWNKRSKGIMRKLLGL